MTDMRPAVGPGVGHGPEEAVPGAQRLFTSYLPPIWGWFTLTWMRRRELL